MSSTVILIDLLGAVAMLIWGLRMLKSGMERVFGTRLRLFLAAGTRNRFMAFGVGLLMTLVLQSSTATAIMTSSFVGQGLISLGMSQAVMLGADVGTSIVTQILSFKIHWISSVLLLVGVFVLQSFDTARSRGIGRSLVGLGMMLLALRLMGEATVPMRSSFTVQLLLGMLGNTPLFAVLAAAALAAIAASSLAIVLFVMSLATAGSIDPALCVLFVVGANLGAAVPPLFAAGGDPAARRVVLGNLGMRAVGALLVLIASPFIGELVGVYGQNPRFAVDVHVAFNLALAILFLPFVTLVAAVVRKVLPIRADSMENGPKHLGEESLATPTTALAAATRETLRIGDTVEKMLEASLGAFRSNDERQCMAVREMEEKVNTLQEAVKLYLSRLSRLPLDEVQTRQSAAIVSYAINLEHIGDIVEKNLSRLALRKIRNQLSFSAEGFTEIETLYLRTLDNLHLAQTVFMAHDVELARKLVESKVDIRHMEQQSSENHLRRFQEGRVESLQTSALHLDILRDLKRINAHITSVAYPILDELGVLRESRLRKEGKSAG